MALHPCLWIRSRPSIVLLFGSFVQLSSAQDDTQKINPVFHTLFNFAKKPETIDFGDWIALLTLCFAPLLAHIIAGAPSPVYLSRQKPPWHERICIYNPTSILWRYFAITDRRLRHKAWNLADMAASNAYFWTDRGWDGSEEIMARSRVYCIRVPRHRRTAILSVEALSTLIVSLQGLQAMYVIVNGLLSQVGIGNNSFSGTIALDSIFFPLSVFGLLRLFAALWLTNDYSYADHPRTFDAPARHQSDETDPAKAISSRIHERTLTTMSLLEPSHGSARESFGPQNSWRAITLRVFFLASLVCLWIICIFYIIPFMGQDNLVLSPTTLTLFIFYTLLLSVSILTFIVLFIRGKSTTTVIPCVSSIWYKLYTGLLVVTAVTLIVVAGINTRRTACGRYTTYPRLYDQGICNGVAIDAEASIGSVGIAGVSGGTTARGDEMSVVYLDGWCSGTLKEDIVHMVVPL